MKKLNTTFCLLLTLTLGYAQMKYPGDPGLTTSHGSTGIVDLRQVKTQSRGLIGTNRVLHDLVPLHVQSRSAPNGVHVMYGENHQPIAVIESAENRMPYDLQRSAESVANYLSSRASALGILDPASELHQLRVQTDGRKNSHIRFQQVYQGWEIYGAEVVVHTRDGFFNAVTGRWRNTPEVNVEADILSVAQIDEILRSQMDLQTIDEQLKVLLPREQVILKKVIFYPEDGSEALLAYHADIYPDAASHWHVILNAIDGSILKKFEDVCRFYRNTSHTHSAAHCDDAAVTPSTGSLMENGHMVMDGDVIATQQDLGGINRTVHNYQIGTNFFMIDASRGMFNATQSNLPDEPQGVLWTLDGNNGSPQDPDFSVSHAHSNNNTWTPLEISAHWNSGTAYEYFLNTHGRNSISGTGGNIISVINVRDENGNDMDNAFWNGYAMFYGNGDQAFDRPLARALDVAGHEMSHGVIQNTANLEYVGQSGALNESFADIFGAMIDREDWRLGEDVVNDNIFSSGALRDLSDPHNGGNGQGDAGWQPAHMNEYVNLPNTPEGDNGGVHINSGIVNRAFFLFASQVGKDVAEDVYYHALNNYLVKSSQFIDARLAIINSAEDLFPAQPQIATAAASAFTMVGIGSGQGGNYQEDLNVNPGDDFVILTDNDLSQLYIYDPVSNQVVALSAPAPLSRPSLSDDGSVAVYVDQQQTLKAILFDWSGPNLDYDVVNLESTPQSIWRNIAISKRGERIAFLTDDYDNLMYVYDFDTQQEEAFELYNPTSGAGISTGGVLYADVMEWDYSGEYVMYDALNEIDGTFGDGIQYWDISFIRVWDNTANDFSFGQVDKLFTNLPENVSVGNATFSKNSPHIIAFDFIEETTDIFGDLTTEYYLLTANLETGRVVTVFNNDALSYPSYSRLDDVILFDSRDPQNQSLLLTAYIEMQPQDKMSPVPNSADILITGGHFATWSSTGQRVLTSTETIAAPGQLLISPNPAIGEISITLPDQSGDIELRMLDYSGSIVYANQFLVSTGGTTKIDVRNIPTGIYMIQVIADDRQFSGRVMIQH